MLGKKKPQPVMVLDMYFLFSIIYSSYEVNSTANTDHGSTHLFLVVSSARSKGKKKVAMLSLMLNINMLAFSLCAC